MDQTTLLADPVFQLNTLLWSLEDLPAAGDIDPVLRNAGYYVVAIGRSVIVPVDPKTLDVLGRLLGSQDRSPSRPDLWLKHQTDEVQPLLELKARGFSPTSSNSKQATKLLVSSTDLAPSTGGEGPQPGHVIYVTIAEDAELLAQTLAELRNTIDEEGMRPAPAATIGLTWLDEGVALMSPRPEDLPAPMQAALSGLAVVLRAGHPEDDIQPLYVIPWIPGIEDSQDPELQSDGLRQLTARLLAETMARVGRAVAPTTLTLNGVDLLDRATYGVFSRWRDLDRGRFALAAAKIIERALRATGHARLQGDRVEVDVPTPEVQDAVMDRLERADPSDPARNLEGVLQQPPTLFDEARDDLEASPDADGSPARVEED